MKLHTSLYIAAPALMAAQAISGLLFSSSYRDLESLKLLWLGNDAVTLAVALPMLVLSMRAAKGGSPRARLAWMGALGYGVYNYAYYMLGAALNVFFPLYVLSLLVSLGALAAALASPETAKIPEAFRQKTPRRTLGGFFIFVGTGLAFVWLGIWAAYVFAGAPTPVAVDFFRLVASLDLTMIVTLLVAGGILLWRGKPWGYIISPIAGVLGTLYLLVLAVNSFVAAYRNSFSAAGELPIWGSLVLGTAAATITLLANAQGRAGGARN